jgi:hypothetical protein
MVDVCSYFGGLLGRTICLDGIALQKSGFCGGFLVLKPGKRYSGVRAIMGALSPSELGEALRKLADNMDDCLVSGFWQRRLPVQRARD